MRAINIEPNATEPKLYLNNKQNALAPGQHLNRSIHFAANFFVECDQYHSETAPAIVSPQIGKMLESMGIKVAHVGEAEHFHALPFVDVSRLPDTSRLTDPLASLLHGMCIESPPPRIPEGLTPAALILATETFPIRTLSRDTVERVEVKVELGDDVLLRLLPFLDSQSDLFGVFAEKSPKSLAGKMFLALVNGKDFSLLSVQQWASQLTFSAKVIGVQISLVINAFIIRSPLHCYRMQEVPVQF